MSCPVLLQSILHPAALRSVNRALILLLPGGSGSKRSACNAGDMGQEDLLEKEMATRSSILAWEISRMEEPCGLQSMGIARVRQDSDSTTTSVFKLHLILEMRLVLWFDCILISLHCR